MSNSTSNNNICTNNILNTNPRDIDQEASNINELNQINSNLNIITNQQHQNIMIRNNSINSNVILNTPHPFLSHSHTNTILHQNDPNIININLNNLVQSENQTVINLVNQSNLVNLINDTVSHQQQQQFQQNLQQQLQLDQRHEQFAEYSQSQQHQQQQQTENPNGFVNLLIRTLQTSLPFVLIMLVKILHQHLFGFFIVIGFLTTLHYSNKTLIFLSPDIDKMDTWNLIWIVVCSDTIVKFLLISLKAFATLLPFRTIPLRRRGNLYSTIEALGLFYRYLIPIHPWILFLINSESNNRIKENTNILTDASNSVKGSSSTIFPLFLCILYLIFKINQIYNGFNDLVQSTRELLTNSPYGIPVVLNEFDENLCPICQDKYTNPVILKCKHTFCQDCVCLWLDKENSCPMCRARISLKKPKFKDGSTTILVQWF